MNEPLVSVPVITYNSSAYIIKGLESIKTQTYKNIELIISDDCSTDNTVELCRKWLNENGNRFTRTLLVTTEKNTGVAGNLNRAICHAQGEWIKSLSGDDKFFPKTIQSYIDYVTSHPDCNIVFGKFKFFGDNDNLIRKNIAYYESRFYPKIKLGRQKQCIEILKEMFVPGPGLFFKKALYDKVGGYDERYPFCEEDPFMYKVIIEGRNRIHFFDNEVYGYCVRQDSLAREGKGKIINRHLADRIRFYCDERRKKQLEKHLYLYAFDETCLYNYWKSKDSNKKFLRFIYTLLLLISPIRYKEHISSLFIRK